MTIDGDRPRPVARPCGQRLTEGAARRLIRDWHPQLVGWAEEIVRRRVRGHLQARALAEIVPAIPGDVTLRLVAAARRGADDESISGLLFRLTERATMHAVGRLWRTDRRERPSSVGQERQEAASPGPDAEAALIATEEARERKEEHRRVRAFVRRLPARERHLIEARFWGEPIAFRELGRRHGMSEEAARIAVFRAIRKLRAALAPSFSGSAMPAGSVHRGRRPGAQDGRR